MERQSIGAFLNDFLRHGAEPAYVQKRGYRVERWTYGEVAQLAFQAARQFEALGLIKGDRVLLWGENCAEWVAAFFACALTGIIAVPMDDAAAPDFARLVLVETSAKFVIASSKHELDLSPGSPSMVLEQLRTQVSGNSSSPFAAAAVAGGDPLEIIFTSGTTAAPKGVVISHANVLSNVAPLETEIRNYLKYERWVHPVRFLNLLPLSHVFGQFLGLFLPPLMAGTVVFQSALGPSEVIDTIRRERVSVLVAVPRMLQSLKDKIERDLEEEAESERFRKTFESSKSQHFLHRWWTFRKIRRQFGWKFWAFISGGAALDAETEEFWDRLGYAVIQGYGLTETTSLVSVNHPFRLGKGSIGKVLAGRDVKLADDGEILVRGGGVASGYWQDGQMASVAGEEGWYRTGDVGALDEQGNLYFKGRKKNVLITPAGMNVYPEDLEVVLRKQPEVRDCVVIGMERGGNAEPCAVLILRDSVADAEKIVRTTNDSLAEYQRIREWYVWPDNDFPRTSTGKPKVSVIADVARTKPGPEAGIATNAGLDRRARTPVPPLAELVSKISGRVVDNLRPDADLDRDLQLSSLERVELMSALEDRFQVDLKETSYSGARTVGDLEKLLADQGAGRVQYHYPRWTLSTPVRWLRTSAYYMLVLPAMRLLGWPHIEGREHLDGLEGPLLVVCNHIDDVDVGFVQAALPARFRHFLATATGGEALERLRTSPAGRGWALRIYDRIQWALGVALLNLFPLPREAAFLKSFSYAGECVDRGYSVLVFPEGHHTVDGKLRPFRAGVGLLATKLNVPVLPMKIEGLFEVKKAGKRFAPPGKIRVRIGEPVRFESSADPQWIAQELHARVAEL